MSLVRGTDTLRSYVAARLISLACLVHRRTIGELTMGTAREMGWAPRPATDPWWHDNRLP